MKQPSDTVIPNELKKTLVADAIIESIADEVILEDNKAKGVLPVNALAEQAEGIVAEAYAEMSDGLENLVTGMGTDAEKAMHNKWTHSGKNLDWVQLSARFREDWVSQKVCTIIPQDLTRTWRTPSTQEGIDADEDWDLDDKFREATKWARVYGTAFIILDVKGSGALHTPLNMKKLKKNCIKSLQVIDRTRMVPTGIIDTNPMSVTYGQPTHYQFVNSAARIHHSRLLRFEATELPLYEQMRNQWYSDSTLIPLMEVIDNFHTAAKSAAQLCQEAVIDVVSIDGLQNILTNPEGEAQIMKRFRVMKQLKSVYNVLLLDSTEEFSTKSVALNGVKDLIWEYLRIIAAAVGIPATRFLSASPDGMNATGESDLNNYIDMLEGLQKSMFKPKLKIVDKLLQAHYGIEPWTYKFNCIFPESASQEATRIKDIISPLAELVAAGIMKPAVALQIIIDKKLYGDTNLGTAPANPPQTKGESKNETK